MRALAAPYFEHGNRAIRLAILISLALHAALVLVFPALREAQQRRNDAIEPILARLVQPQPGSNPVPPQALAEAAKPLAKAAAPKRQLGARQAPDAPQAKSREPSSAEPVPQVAPEKGVAAAIEPSPSGGPLSAAPAIAAIARQPETAAAPSPDAGTLAQYRLAIIAAARRYKRYPRIAVDNHWQGKVEIRMAIGANGAISSLSVRTSTGHPLLDQHALEMIEKAKEMAQIPPALRGTEFTMDIPVVFSLRDSDA